MPSTELLVPGDATPARRRRRWIGRTLLVALLVGVAVVAYHSVHRVARNFGSPMCRAVALGTPVTFDPEQTANAATITTVAVRRHLPARAATIALATAIQESKLRNVTYGDKDSIGLFQQRTSQGWGSRAQILDPVHASNAFYDALVKIDGYQSMPITQVAQKVQRSAYPAAYAQHEQEGRVLASTLSGLSEGGVGCRLDPAKHPGDPPALAKALGSRLDVRPMANGKAVTVTATTPELAWACGAWAVAHANAARITAVTVGDRTWTRSREESAWSWARAASPTGSPTSVRITVA
jgi:hypothetical protein